MPSTLQCVNPDCPEYQIPKQNPDDLADVVCGHCGRIVVPVQ